MLCLGVCVSSLTRERRSPGAPLFVTFSVAVVVPLFLGYFQPVGAAFAGNVRPHPYVEILCSRGFCRSG